MSVDEAWVRTNFPDLSNVQHISTGGQKTVFRAEHPTDGVVVLKIIDPLQDPQNTEREVLAVASINSNRVPRIHEYGKINCGGPDYLWLREQLIPGQTLEAVLTTSRLDLDEAIRLCRHLLEALQDAETAQIVHRDVKPANIIRDNQGNFWLIDFGIARHLTLQSLTATANLFGKLTLGYAPTEQMRNNKPQIDARADLFALGVTLIEAFTGTNPFWNPPPANPMEVIKRVETQALAIDFGPSPKAKALSQLVSALAQKRRDLRPRNSADALSWLSTIEQMT